MRRFQNPAMTPKGKPYESASRSPFPSYGPNSSKSRLIKLLAAMVAAAFALYALHSILFPHDLVYGLMIDAGSTGSRIHTYTFRKHPQTAELKVISEDFFALKPGLSSYKASPTDAASSLAPLIARAKSRVPNGMHAETPVVLRATAGLRMTGEQVANAILKEVRTYLKGSGFRFDNDSWATILSGNEEAVYSWITVNYLLNRDADHTVGTLEMGGGSAQVAYVPRDGSMAKQGGGSNCSMDGEKLSYMGKQVDLYTVSHLDFGLQKARALLLKQFRDSGKLSGNACINRGATVKAAVPFDEGGAQLSFSEGAGNFAGCRELVAKSLMDPSTGKCGCDACTYHGAAQPKAIGEYVAFAFYLERTVAIGMETPMTMRDIVAKGSAVCGMSVAEVRRTFGEVPNGEATDLCLDLAYISLHLERGHGIGAGADTKLMVVSKINDFELGWCLGAMQQTMAQLGPK